MELSAPVAADLRAAADANGFEDPEAFLRELLDDSAAREDVERRLATVERRLDDLEATVEDTDGRETVFEDRAVVDVIDEALAEPQGADDEDVSAAVRTVDTSGES